MKTVEFLGSTKHNNNYNNNNSDNEQQIIQMKIHISLSRLDLLSLAAEHQDQSAENASKDGLLTVSLSRFINLFFYNQLLNSKNYDSFNFCSKILYIYSDAW